MHNKDSDIRSCPTGDASLLRIKNCFKNFGFFDLATGPSPAFLIFLGPIPLDFVGSFGGGSYPGGGIIRPTAIAACMLFIAPELADLLETIVMTSLDTIRTKIKIRTKAKAIYDTIGSTTSLPIF
ncbi:hypothetical protein BpHYR1_052245 [Brachionus plicatilis]|uniref:Uncharacterized protein n=1 Tax=Brachionus plicatilis TaxID=10195 RepID=A0A3M7TA41_BRAPC|nr:hypothetical protein BpHYR1_052245 [Brachionus plicatilis]